jgi:hypothetical protein
LLEISLDTKIIFNDEVSPPYVSIPDPNPWKTGGGTHKVNNGESLDLIFTFELSALSSGYNVSIGFDNGCTIEKSK